MRGFNRFQKKTSPTPAPSPVQNTKGTDKKALVLEALDQINQKIENTAANLKNVDTALSTL